MVRSQYEARASLRLARATLQQRPGTVSALKAEVNHRAFQRKRTGSCISPGGPGAPAHGLRAGGPVPQGLPPPIRSCGRNEPERRSRWNAPCSRWVAAASAVNELGEEQVVTSSKGMGQVSGTTYRIVESARCYQVVRLLDDRVVGAFRNETGLELMLGEIPVETLTEIARQAHRSARLSWRPPRNDQPSWFASCLRRVVTGWNRCVAVFRDVVAESAGLQAIVMLRRPISTRATAAAARSSGRSAW
jgi:hypothetical protein